jgi:CheY-like chemotaxis protein
MIADPIILYVEDDAQSREVMELLVSEVMGVKHLTIFHDSADFLNRVAGISPSPNIILLDIHVEPLTGFDMLALLRQDSRFRDVPVVALTASVMNEEVRQLQQAGFNGVIPKPVDVDRFPDLLAKMIGRQEVWNTIV